MDLNEPLMYMNVKIVLIVHYVPYVPEQKKEKKRKLFYNQKWESQKEYIREKLSNEEAGEIYGKRKIDVEPFFGFLKANLGFTRMSVRGNSNVHNEMGFALMAVNIKKYTVINDENGTFSPENLK